MRLPLLLSILLGCGTDPVGLPDAGTEPVPQCEPVWRKADRICGPKPPHILGSDGMEDLDDFSLRADIWMNCVSWIDWD